MPPAPVQEESLPMVETVIEPVAPSSCKSQVYSLGEIPVQASRGVKVARPRGK